MEVLDHGFSGYVLPYSFGPTLSYGIRLRNPNPSTWIAGAVELVVTFRNVAGAVVYVDDLATARSVEPGGTAAVGATAIYGVPEVPSTMEVRINCHTWWKERDVEPGGITMGPATTRPIPPDGTVSVITRLAVRCAATSTFAAPVDDFGVSVLFLDPQGTIIGGDSRGDDIDGIDLTIAAHTTTDAELLSHHPPPDGVPAAECYPSYSPMIR